MLKENKTLIKTMNATVHLLEKSDFDSISVSDIVKECGFSRQNFYKNFSGKQALIREILLYDFRRAIEQDYIFRFGYSSKIVFSCFYEHKALYKAVLKSENSEYLFRLFYEYSYVIINSFVEYSAFRADAVQQRAIDFFVRGLTSTLFSWFSGKLEYSTAELSEIFSENIPNCLRSFITEEGITSDYLLYKIKKRGEVW